jgi:uncharacterized protein
LAEIVSTGDVAALAAFAFLGALIFGITGFGSTLVTIPLATHLVSLKFALAAFSVSDLVNALIVGFENPKNADRGEWARLVPTILLGTALGMTLLINLPRAMGMFLLGLFVTSFALYSFWRRAPAHTTISQRWAAVSGLVGGITSALFGAGGPLYAIYLSQRGLSKERFRATMGFVMLTAILLRFTGFLVTGLLLDPNVLLTALFVVPGSLLGVFVGRRLVRAISGAHLMHIVVVLLFASGVSLIYRATLTLR